MRLLFLLSLVFYTLCSPAWSQRMVTFAQSFKVNPHTVGRIECLLPESVPGRQSAIKLEYNLQPDDTLRRYGGLVAVWNISRASHYQEIMVLSTMELSVNSLIQSNPNSLKREDSLTLLKYLEPEKTIQSNDRKISELAIKLRGDNDVETTRNAFNFVVDHLEYHVFYNQRQGVKNALRKGRGDCTEYAGLMIAILRNLGIPARLAMGVTLHSDEGKRIGFHNWVEVYLEEHGWVSFDPTWADGENSFTTFERMQNCYILLGYGHAASAYDYRTSGGDFQIKYKSNWESPATAIENRVQLALWKNNAKAAHKSLDTLLSWSPENSNYIAFRAEAFMLEGDFETALPLIQLSMRRAKNKWVEGTCKLNLAAYLANTSEQQMAMKILLALEEEDEFYANQVIGKTLFEPLSDLTEFKELRARGKEYSLKLRKEYEARQADKKRKPNN